MRKVAIIVPVFNQLHYTQQLFKSILDQIPSLTTVSDVYLVIVDNASTDNTSNFLSSGADYTSPFPELVCDYVRSELNLGYGEGSNRGIEYALSKYGEDLDFIVMNNDMILLPGCIDELVKAAYSANNIGVVGGKLLFPDGTIQHAGAFLSAFGWGMHKGGGIREEDYLIEEKLEEQEYVTGALLYIKGALISQIGLFDTQFEKGYFEEVDFQYRAREEGFISVYCPTARAIHFENVTSKAIAGSAADVKKQISDKNQIKFYLKRDCAKKEAYARADSGDDTEPKLLIASKIYGEWSFCGVMRNLAKGLSRNGVDVSIAPEEYHFEKLHMPDFEIKNMIDKPNDYWNRSVLRSSEGDHMYLMPPGKQRIAHTTGESNLVNSDWVAQLNNVDKVVTTSTFFRNVMLNSGVKSPIFVVPNSVNLDLFKKEGNILPIDNLKGLNFVSVFHFGARKAPEVLVRAFCKAFSNQDDVTLTIHSLSMKQNLEKAGMTISEWINSLVDKTYDKPTILVTSTFIDDSLMPAFMRNFDVFVLPTRGEGFGLPVLEASALGMPSIVTGYSGVTDLVDTDNGWLIDYKLKDIPLQYLPYYQNYIGGQWAEPNEDHLIELFRHVYNHREEIKAKGDLSFERAQQYGISNIGKLAKSVIFDL